MATPFKEYNNNTFYIGPEGTVSNKGQLTFFLLSDSYSKYPKITNSLGTIYFGLKQDDTFNKLLSQNIDTYNGGNGFYFTSSASDCWAKVGPTNVTYSPDSDTGMTIQFSITPSQNFRVITFKWKDFVVFKVIQGQSKSNKLLICKPTFFGNIDSYNTVIGFSTSEITISNQAFKGHGGTGINKCLCTISTDPSYIKWQNKQIQYASLTYLKGKNFKNIYPDYWLTDMIVDNNGTIINGDFDKIKALRYIYIFTQSSNGPQKIGYVIMEEQGDYMLAEI